MTMTMKRAKKNVNDELKKGTYIFYMYYLQHERPCCIGRVVLYVRYNTDANVVNGSKNSSSYEPTGEKSLEIDEVYAEKIKVKVYANQQNSVS